VLTTTEVTPNVCRKPGALREQPDRSVRQVPVQKSTAGADRAVAFPELGEFGVDLDADRVAMTRDDVGSGDSTTSYWVGAIE